ncbi:DUF167 domain-containing protein [Candidatus Cyanaurora vandensis]|uniref:DUF167 domain-containing protein n=1 Tax=Candidatus Cyanaurora vandensis TaxID=2714958 RepID=UPI00258075B9|nr:DUF167 domain-containing protein [Candidatus Cyanaurora vandensis]
MMRLVKVKPNAKHQLLSGALDGSFIAHLKSPPTEGKANQELVNLLADHFNVTKAQVTIVAGFTSRHKVVEIDQ